MDKTAYFYNAFKAVAENNPEATSGERFLGSLEGLPAFAYVRVANIRNGHNSSAEQQFEDIHKHACKEGYHITWERVFCDRSGRQNLFGRSGVKSMLEEILKPENGGSVVLVDGLWEFTDIESDWKKLGEICLESNVDILVCIKGGYLLSVLLRIMSDESSIEQKLKLYKSLGWEPAF